tara:strand:+ start:1231 stop:1467 length:237 start_codon:yes stop_codon:yes gene_type:complete
VLVVDVTVAPVALVLLTTLVVVDPERTGWSVLRGTDGRPTAGVKKENAANIAVSMVRNTGVTRTPTTRTVAPIVATGA